RFVSSQLEAASVALPSGSVKAIVPTTKAMMIAAEPKKITGDVRRRKASCSLVSKVLDSSCARGTEHVVVRSADRNRPAVTEHNSGTGRSAHVRRARSGAPRPAPPVAVSWGVLPIAPPAPAVYRDHHPLSTRK